MRLGQIARKYKLESSKVLDLLETKGFDLVNDPNIKLTDEQVSLVDEKYKPLEEDLPKPSIEVEVPEVKEVSPAPVENPIVEAPKEEEQEEPIVEKVKETPVEVVTTADIIEALEEVEDTDEVAFANKKIAIRAVKTELPGIKVVGKIELPESDEDYWKSIPKPERKKRRKIGLQDTDTAEGEQPTKKKIARKVKTEVTYEASKAQRDEEDKKRVHWAKKKAERELRAEKEKRKNEFMEQFKSKQTPAKSKKKKVQAKKELATEAQTSGNIFAKFWSWLNSY